MRGNTFTVRARAGLHMRCAGSTFFSCQVSTRKARRVIARPTCRVDQESGGTDNGGGARSLARGARKALVSLGGQWTWCIGAAAGEGDRTCVVSLTTKPSAHGVSSAHAAYTHGSVVLCVPAGNYDMLGHTQRLCVSASKGRKDGSHAWIRTTPGSTSL